MAPIYSYGSFQLNNISAGYVLLAKNLDFLTYKPVVVPLARHDGLKIAGYQIAERSLQISVRIIGTSRIDAMQKKDVLEAALAVQNQPLTLHEDGRYIIASATVATGKFAAGTGIVQIDVPITFIAQDPTFYALTQNQFDTGVIAYTPVSTSYVSPLFTFAGGGTFYSYPTIRLTHKTPFVPTTLQSAISFGSTYTSLTVAPLPTNITINAPLWIIGIGIRQRVVASSSVSSGATTIPVASFTASHSFSIGATVSLSSAWNALQIAQITDNRILAAVSTFTAFLPQSQGDYVDIVCDPAANNGWQLLTNGSMSIAPTGPFPVLQPGTTVWQITLTADSQPSVQATWTWTPRYTS